MSNTTAIVPSQDILAHVVDVHCHPTDSPISDSAMEALNIHVCAMATRHKDQPLVASLAQKWPDKVTPCFGYHPWFTHWISVSPPISKESHYRSLLLNSTDGGMDDKLDAAFERILPQLPEPILLSDVLSDLRQNFVKFPNAMLGEVGLDRAFRIPWSSEGPKHLSNFTVPLNHQLHILEAQLDLAVELQRNVSLHSVKCQQATLEFINRMANKHGERWDMISIDMHSCGLSAQMWKSLEKNHPNVYLSLSTAINSRSPSHKELIATCDPKRLLVESDYHDIILSTPKTWAMVLLIGEVKGWNVETEWKEDFAEDQWGVVRKLEENWREFTKGNHIEKRKKMEERKKSRRVRKDVDWELDSDGD